MTAFANAFLLVFAGLFPILNPVGTAPIFLALTSSCTEAERTLLARRVAINSVLLLAGSMFIGSYLLVFFGITLPVVRIAGGLVLTAFGWKLLHDGVEREDNRSSEAKSHSTTINSFYPLTMPLTVGPGRSRSPLAWGASGPKDPSHYRSLRYSADRLSRGSSRSRLRSIFVTASPSVQPPYWARTVSMSLCACPPSFSCALAFRSCGPATAR